ncbi:MAG: hypothetical protein ACI8RD_003125 [Bacillariaceae sp.]|jgi:hypothetical protein
MLLAMNRLHLQGLPNLKPDAFTYTAVIDVSTLSDVQAESPFLPNKSFRHYFNRHIIPVSNLCFSSEYFFKSRHGQKGELSVSVAHYSLTTSLCRNLILCN